MGLLPFSQFKAPIKHFNRASHVGGVKKEVFAYFEINIYMPVIRFWMGLALD